MGEDMGDPGMEGLDADDGVMEDEGDGLRARSVVPSLRAPSVAVLLLTG